MTGVSVPLGVGLPESVAVADGVTVIVAVGELLGDETRVGVELGLGLTEKVGVIEGVHAPLIVTPHGVQLSAARVLVSEAKLQLTGG